MALATRESQAPMLIGIAGGTGSGKTTLATRIPAALPAGTAELIQHDWYYRDRSHLTAAERQAINFDEPDALENALLIEDLKRLKAGAPVACPQYDFVTHTRTKEIRTVLPRPILIVEGILLFSVPALCELFDLRIFVDTDDDIRLLRRIRRDIIERGRDIESIARQYQGTVRPMHLLHVAPAKRRAHLIVPEGGENDEALDVIVGRLQWLLRP